MTNSPIFEEQLALSAYWKDIGGTVMLPGTNRAADRPRGQASMSTPFPRWRTARRPPLCSGVIRNVSVPYGISTPGQPNISSTRWRTVADHKDRRYYFESALTPNVFWVDFENVDFSPGSGARTLQLGANQSRTFSGEVSAKFEPAKPFRFHEVSPN